jgi:hypothetical protein
MTTKITRLSPTDVANTGPLETGKKKQYLELIETPKVYWGYDPVRSAFPKLLLVSSGLFGDLPKDSDATILEQIRRACHSNVQEAANIGVAEAIIAWRDETKARGVLVAPEPFRASTGTISFCADVAVIVDEKLFVINLDVRSKMNLTVKGKELMKSLIHHTALIGDLKTASVAILRTPNIKKGQRLAILEMLEGEPAYTLDQVEAMILETYAIWETILMARRATAAKSADGSSGTLI